MSTWNPKANDIFLRALELGSHSERGQYVAVACAGDESLRTEVEALLAAGDQAGSFLELPALARELAATIDRPIVERLGTMIGRYKLLEQIGEGGFGIVFMAEQQEPVRRKVALKVLKPGMDTRQVVARFEAERQALALMDHPSIAHVFDGGTTAAGRPYFVMDLVKGIPITEYCDQNQIAPRERLELFVQVCEAVQHAHQKGIIHRDVKPSNVLISRHDGTPVAKVIDFGIAKALGQQLTEKTLFTNFAQLVGTPLYMSPEQAGMSDLDVDTRSDIYSLGVLLYELLTGTTPFDADRFRDAGVDEMRRIIREEEPPKPSTRVSTVGIAAETVSANRQSDPKQLSRLFRGELDWIVMKAMEKDRDRRYKTPNGLAMDVKRYLHDEPVLACPPSAVYRFRKFARRRRAALVMAVCVLLGLSGIAGGVGWAVRDKSAREQEVTRRFAVRDAILDAEISRALNETGPLLEEGNWQAALTVVERADKLLSAAGRSDRPARLLDLKQALTIAQRLDEAYLEPHLNQSSVRLAQASAGAVADAVAKWQAADEEFFSGRAQNARFADLFRELGIDVEALETSEAAAQIRAKNIRLALFRALDEWAMLRRRAVGREGDGWKKLVEIAAAADDNPWRRRFRSALLQRDRKALEQLADTAPLAELTPATAYLLAMFLRELESLDKALVVLRAAVRQHPDDFWLNSELGWLNTVAVQPPRYDEAVRYHSAALATWPLHVKTHVALADLLMKTGDVDGGIAHYARAIEIDPRDAATHYSLGQALRAQSRLEDAVKEYRESIRRKPDYASAHNELGVTLYALGRNEEAIAEFREAIRVGPFPAPYGNLGKALQEQGKLDEAIAIYRESLRIHPGHAWARRGLSFALRRQGKTEEAAAELESAELRNQPFAGAETADEKRLKPLAIFEGMKASWSPDGAKLVLDSGVGIRALRLCDVATGNCLSLTWGRDPAFSPTGDLIAFVRSKGDVEEIWSIAPDGKNERKIAEGGFPGWLNGGKTLYYHSRREWQIKTIEIGRDGSLSEPRDMYPHAQSLYPVVSPDSRRIAYIAEGRLNVAQVDGGPKVVRLLPGATGGCVGWSPDSRRIGYGGYGEGDNAGLWIFDIGSGDTKQVLPGPFTCPTWSPDGKLISIDLRRRRAASEVWVVDVANLGPFAAE